MDRPTRAGASGPSELGGCPAPMVRRIDVTGAGDPARCLGVGDAKERPAQDPAAGVLLLHGLMGRASTGRPPPTGSPSGTARSPWTSAAAGQSDKAPEGQYTREAYVEDVEAGSRAAGSRPDRPRRPRDRAR